MNVHTHSVKSEYQSGSSTVEVLLPDGFDAARRYPVLYVLPVFAGDERTVGSSLAQLGGLDVICVRPVFNTTPWYAGQQEEHLLKAVLPFVESQYRTSDRLLVGFSKSGWGAFSLLLRHPELFRRAAAFDAPLLHDRPDRWEMEPVFGTQENFERYRLTNVLKERAALFQNESRFVLIGYDNFQEHVIGAHELMLSLGIRHEYIAGPRRAHRWDSGWLNEAVEGISCSESKV